MWTIVTHSAGAPRQGIDQRRRVTRSTGPRSATRSATGERAEGSAPVAGRFGPIRLELLESLALPDRAQLRLGRISWGAEGPPCSVTVAVARVDAGVVHADIAGERQPGDLERDVGLTRGPRVLVVSVPPHEHAHAAAAIGGGERVDLLRHSPPRVVEPVGRPRVARRDGQGRGAEAGPHPVGGPHGGFNGPRGGEGGAP